MSDNIPALAGDPKGISEEALKKAERTGKPVLLHQLVGDMKAEGW